MNIPKSLHTVSAIVAVARYCLQNEPVFADSIARGNFYWVAARAAEILGYPVVDTTDTYGLILRAADTLKKGAAA